MPPLRGLLRSQVLCAGPVHTEAVVLLVGHDSSWSRMLPPPSPGALPGQFVTAKVTSPPPEALVSGWPQSRKQVRWGWLHVKHFCSQSLEKARPRFHRRVARKEDLFFWKLDCTAAWTFSGSSTDF